PRGQVTPGRWSGRIAWFCLGKVPLGGGRWEPFFVPPKNAREPPTCAAWNGSAPIPAPGTLNGRYCETANRMPRFRRFNVAKAGVAASTLPAARSEERRVGKEANSDISSKYW